MEPRLRTRLVRKLLTRFPVGSFETRLGVGSFEAKALGYKAVSALEFGVAGDNGLLLLCQYRDQVERETGVRIALYGLDAGTGLPPSSDPRGDL